MTSSMSGSWIDRSATSYDAATAATTGAALASAGNDSHWRGPSTRRTTAPSTSIGRCLVHQVHHQRAGRAALLVQPGQRAVEDRGAVVDHDHPVAQRLDVLQVVGREDEGGAALVVERAEELAQATLAHHVQADRRLVEVEHLGIVQQRRGDVAPHPLAEAELAHRGVELVAEVEQVDEPVEVVAVARRGRSGTSSAAGRTSRAAGGPTTASSAGRRPPRCDARARRGRGSGPGRPPAPAHRSARGSRSAS